MKKVKVNALRAGQQFRFSGFDWIVLDPNYDGGVLSIMESAARWHEYSFDRAGCNNYISSDAREFLLDEILPRLGEENLLSHVINNEEASCGKIADKVFLLSRQECRKYQKYLDWCGLMWTRTSWHCDPNMVYVLLATYLGNLWGARSLFLRPYIPTCIFNPQCLKLHRKK